MRPGMLGLTAEAGCRAPILHSAQSHSLSVSVSNFMGKETGPDLLLPCLVLASEERLRLDPCGALLA